MVPGVRVTTAYPKWSNARNVKQWHKHDFQISKVSMSLPSLCRRELKDKVGFQFSYSVQSKLEEVILKNWGRMIGWDVKVEMGILSHVNPTPSFMCLYSQKFHTAQRLQRYSNSTFSLRVWLSVRRDSRISLLCFCSYKHINLCPACQEARAYSNCESTHSTFSNPSKVLEISHCTETTK